VKSDLRRFLMGAPALAAVLPILSLSQQRPAIAQVAVHRLGFLGLRPLPQSEPAIDQLRAGLVDLGYAEGKNYVLVIRLADDSASRYPALVRELSDSNVELIVAASIPAAVAIHQQDPAMKIVIAQGPDIVGNKLAASAEHPGVSRPGSRNSSPV